MTTSISCKRSGPSQNLRTAIAIYPTGSTTSESLSVFGAIKPSESERWDWLDWGSREGGKVPSRDALTASVMNSKTLRFWERRLVTTVSIRATKTLPASLWEPKLVRRHSTAGRIALSAALLVGSNPSTVRNSHRAGSSFSNWRQVRTVLARGVFSLEPIW